MNDILENHLALLERQVESELSTVKKEVEDMIGLHVGLFALLEKYASRKDVTKADATAVSLLQRWLKTARRLETLALGFRANGQSVAYFDDLEKTVEGWIALARDFGEAVE
jgi:hypothetical protein